MPADPSKYRRLDYVGGRILQGRELNTQQVLELVRDKQASGVVYREGATLNVELSIVDADVSLVPIDNGKPMYVFVRGCFEPFTASPVSLNPGQTTGQNFIYLNWALLIRTNADDPTLVDISTGEPTARAGELSLSISDSDTSGVALNPGTQLEKNTVPIIMFTFDRGPGGSVTPVYTDNVDPIAVGDDVNSGPVKLTTATAAGIAAAEDDPRMTDDRTPLDDSITPAKVKDLIQTGNNGDGSPQFDPATVGQGGVTTDKSIYDTLKTSVTWILDSIRSTLTSLQTAFTAHVTTRLGSGGSHPLPTAQEIGAAPATHVGQALGRSDTHPALVNDDVGGFEVVRPGVTAANKANLAYGVRQGVTPKGGLCHDGDVYSSISELEVANPLGGGLTSGPLSHIGVIAKVLVEHVNQHPNKNPHGLTAADIGAASESYVNTQDQGVLGTAIAYADRLGGVLVRTVTTPGAAGSYPPGAPLNTYIAPPSQASITYYIFTLGDRFEIAIGIGTFQSGQQVPMPEASGWSTGQWIGQGAPAWALLEYDEDNQAAWRFHVDPVTRLVTARERSAKKGDRNYQWANVWCVAWRTISAPPIIIQFTPLNGTVATVVTITGRNFGLNPTVTFNGTAATPSASSPTSITVPVPGGATTGPIAVTDPATGKTGTSAVPFTVA